MQKYRQNAGFKVAMERFSHFYGHFFFQVFRFFKEVFSFPIFFSKLRLEETIFIFFCYFVFFSNSNSTILKNTCFPKINSSKKSSNCTKRLKLKKKLKIVRKVTLKTNFNNSELKKTQFLNKDIENNENNENISVIKNENNEKSENNENNKNNDISENN